MALSKVHVEQSKNIVALAGGVGGAKFAHGLAQCLPEGHLTVIVNTADDFIHYGLHISPDLDTVMYTLAGYANYVTGWGVVDETWQMATMLKTYGEDVWFNLGDRDLATHLIRTRELENGGTLTAVTERLSQALGIEHRILPATNDPIATVIQTKELGKLAFQEYFVKYRWQPEVIAIEFEGASQAKSTTEVLEALDSADIIFICPSNPMLSIEPVLAPQGIRRAIENRVAPCVAISPLIGGKAVKGPTDKLMHELNLEASHSGIAQFYDGLIDGLVIDKRDEHDVANVQTHFPMLSIHVTDTLMSSIEDRKNLATNVLNWMREEVQ